MKAYANVDEWLNEIENFGTRRERMYEEIDIIKNPDTWVKEAWKQATRTARVQERILVGEIKKLREELQSLEQRYESVWAVLVGEEDDQS